MTLPPSGRPAGRTSPPVTSTVVRSRDERIAAEASAPDCPADRLRALADEWGTVTGGQNTRSAAVLRAVAAHPNTPPDVLGRLLAYSASAFCRNPAAPLVALEAERFLSEATEAGLHELLRWAEAPAPIVALLASGVFADDNTGVAEAARLHIAHAGEVDPGEWRAVMRDYWRGRLRSASDEMRHQTAEMVDSGFGPAAFFDGPLPPAAGAGSPASARTMAFHLRASHGDRVRVAGLTLFAPPALFDRPVEDLTVWQTVTRRLWRDGEPPRSPLARRLAESAPVRRCLAVGLLRSGNPALRRLALRCPQLPPAVRRSYGVGLLDGAGSQASCPPYYDVPSLLSFQHPSTSAAALEDLSFCWHWRGRLIGALCLRRDQERFDALLRPLADHGNRLVRAAARARLRGEEFTWE